MPDCLSPEQHDELLAGALEASRSAHLDECANCRREFERRCTTPEAARWRLAALEIPALAHDDLALLESLKQMPPPAPDDGRDGKAFDYSEYFHAESANGDSPAPPPPKTRLPDVPGFEIQGELGRGGMGVVYRARQTAYDRPVALKMILAGSQASPEELGRFYDEAEAISRLRHPHIVQIFEVGRYDGRLFFVLEFVEGGTLANKISGKSLPARSSAQLVESLARAMHFAHTRGIVHRDLKPANVLLHGRKAFVDAPEDANRLPEDWDFHRYMPKITDFGLAKLLDRGSGDGHTASGHVVGTPSYMAPEQAQGKPSPIAATIDVYSLGAILYEMLTGRPPFQGETPMDTMLKVHSEEPVAPRKIVRDVPSTLETVCLKCLRKRPEQRYQSAEELADDLRLFLEGLPILTRRMNPVLTRVRELQNSAGSWFKGALIFLLSVIAGGLLISVWKLGPTRNSALDARSADLLRENAGLRLRLAQDLCERGEIGLGLTEMTSLLEQVEANHDLQPIRAAVVRNVAKWAQEMPALIFIGPEGVISATFANRTDGLEVVAETTDHKHLNWKIQAPTAFTKPMTGHDAERAALIARVHGMTVHAVGGDNLVLTGGSDRSARLWRIDSGKLLAVLPHPAAVEQVAFAKDDTTFLTRDAQGTVRVWTALPPPENNLGPIPRPNGSPFDLPSAAQIRKWLTRQTGVEWAADGSLQFLSPSEWRE